MGKIIQFCGLSGAGKTTIANALLQSLKADELKVMVIDGDVYRQTHCKDLGFSKADRLENIARLGSYANELSSAFDFVIIAAINPFEEARNKLLLAYNAPVVWIRCELSVLIKRDTKGLYRKALLPDQHPDKIHNLTGINDVFEEPLQPALTLYTDQYNLEQTLYLIIKFLKA